MNKEITLRPKISVKNTYELTLKHPDGTEEKYVNHNMVLDNYYNLIITNNAAPVLNAIRVGQGTTAVVSTDIALASLRGSYSASLTDSYDGFTAIRQLLYSIPEGTLTGNISELGLSNGTAGTTVYTRSLIVDAEGNPITIDKGALDILTIRITVFYTFEGDDTYSYVKWWNKRNASIKLRAGDGLFGNVYFFTALPSQYVQDNINNPITSSPSLRQGESAGTRTYDLVNKTVKVTGAVMLAAQQNGGMTYPEWAAKGIGNDIFIIDVESSGVFTPFYYNNLIVGVGDGVTTEFDIPLVYFKASDVEKIYIDAVEQDTGDYIVNGPSIRRSMRNAPSADMRFLIGFNDVSVSFPITGGYASYYNSPETNAIYDFGAPISVSHVFVKTRPRSVDSYTLRIDNFNLYTSDNGIDWTSQYTHANYWDPATMDIITLQTPLFSRYYRMYFATSTSTTLSTTAYDPIAAFGEDKRSIVFDTPPANGLQITAKILQRVPIKNSNFQLGASFQFKFERYVEEEPE